MFPIDQPLLLAILILCFSYVWADRFAGGGLGWKQLANRGLPGHGVFYSGIVVMAIGYALAGLWGVFFGLSWAISRSMPWKIAGHSALTPVAGDLGLVILRHSFPVLLITLLWSVARMDSSMPSPMSILLMWFYPAVAAGLAYAQSDALRDELDVTAKVETIRGGVFGLLAGVALLYGG